MSRGGNPVTIRVEVVYALRDRQALVAVEVKEGRTVEYALRHSGLLEAFPEIDIARSKLGIFGRLVPLDAPVRDGDRIEIYRPLIADPKDARRERARRAAIRSRRR